MRIAFYAPMKPPSDPVPSGDRRMARLLMGALTLAGHEVELASRVKSRDGVGDATKQMTIRARGEAAARSLISRYRKNPPDAWFTYHVYHKAPDWIGPAVAEALGIPYVIAEASYAPKQAGGKWDMGHRAAAQAISRADAIIGLNSNDAACVRPLVKPGAQMVALRPFLDAAPFTGQRATPAKTPLLLAVAMMRPGDKLASYRVLADALARLGDLDWQLLVVGDGPARKEVEALLPTRTKFAGEVPPERLPEIYAAADLYVWPSVREAYGMALLEAQAAGAAAVAGDCGGVGDILRDGETGLLAKEGDAAAFADAIRALLADPARRARMGARARAVVARDHTIASAAEVLDRVLKDVCRVHA
jgi:glycosyltransferase involved in cell wall biosynthesis